MVIDILLAMVSQLLVYYGLWRSDAVETNKGGTQSFENIFQVCGIMTFYSVTPSK